MGFFSSFFDFILHIDKHLADASLQYGLAMYAILFAIVFAETGLVVAAFLPGDSLLFAAGSICALGALDITLMTTLLFVAAAIGDAVNYTLGAKFGHVVFTRKSRFLKPEYLEKTHSFYEKYGAKTIVIARFVPIVRTFAPFAAGMGNMSYRVFFVYNVIGAAAWTLSLTLAGYFFGQISIVKNNFSVVIFAIIALSLLPPVFEAISARRKKHISTTQ